MRHHVPGENFGGVFTGTMTTIGLDALGEGFRSNTAMSVRTLIGTNIIGGNFSTIGVLNGNGLSGGLAMGISTFSRSTGTTVRTTNKGTRIVWIFGAVGGT